MVWGVEVWLNAQTIDCLRLESILALSERWMRLTCGNAGTSRSQRWWPSPPPASAAASSPGRAWGRPDPAAAACSHPVKRGRPKVFRRNRQDQLRPPLAASPVSLPPAWIPVWRTEARRPPHQAVSSGLNWSLCRKAKIKKSCNCGSMSWNDQQGGQGRSCDLTC